MAKLLFLLIGFLICRKILQGSFFDSITYIIPSTANIRDMIHFFLSITNTEICDVINKKIVITGGPGTGKSSIINYLEAQGHYCYMKCPDK